jgi:hypothetical protein
MLVWVGFSGHPAAGARTTIVMGPVGSVGVGWRVRGVVGVVVG